MRNLFIVVILLMFVNPVYSDEQQNPKPMYHVPKDDRGEFTKLPSKEYNNIEVYDNIWDKEFNAIPIMPYTIEERKQMMELGF